MGGDHQNLKSPPQAGFYYVESRGKNHRYRNSDRRRRGCAAGRPGRKGLNPRATRGGPPKSRPWLLAPTRNPIQMASRLGAWGIAQAQEAGRACLGPRPRTRAGADQGRPGHCHLGAGICALIHSHATSRTHANWPGRLRKDFAVSLGFGGADGRRQTAFGFAISERIVRCDYKPCAERLPLRTAAGGPRGHRSLRACGRKRPGTPGIKVIHPQGSLCGVCP